MSAVLTIDFETFYTKEYSLTKMTTQEYIQSEFFECIGVSVKLNDEETQWFSGTHEETKAWLGQFDWANARAVAHNASFDGAILEWVFDIHPKEWFCTMYAARPLVAPFTNRGRVSLAKVAEALGVGVKGTAVAQAIGFRRRDFSATHLHTYAEYCMLDTNLTYAIYEKLAPRLPLDEHKLIHETLLKFVRPKLRLNRDILVARLTQVRETKALALITAGLHDNKMLMSNNMFAAALENLGVSPPMKLSPATGKPTYAFAKTDAEFKELLDHPDMRVQALMAARFKHKTTLEETRLQRFLSLADLKTPVAVPLRYYAAHTGRYGGSDGLNMQNLPRAGELRRALEAPPGHILVAGDLSQIEARIVAALAGEDDLLRAFAAGDDVYCEFASAVYGRAITKDDSTQRFMGKTAILGLGFGMGAAKYKDTVRAQAGIEITENEAQRVVRVYRNKYPSIPNLWKAADAALYTIAVGGDLRVSDCLYIRKGCIVLPNGMSIYYPDMRPGLDGYEFSYRGYRRKIWGGAITENVVQALARIVLARAELRLARQGLHAVLQVHDELIYSVPERHAEKVVRALELALTAPVNFLPNLPVACEVKTGFNYAEAK